MGTQREQRTERPRGLCLDTLGIKVRISVIVRNTINEHGLIIIIVCVWVGNAEIQREQRTRSRGLGLNRYLLRRS
jgi:hypothetical protein